MCAINFVCITGFCSSYVSTSYAVNALKEVLRSGISKCCICTALRMRAWMHQPVCMYEYTKVCVYMHARTDAHSHTQVCMREHVRP